MKVYENLEQGTENWLQARCGLLTASVVRNVITPKNLSFAKNDKCRAIVYELAAQRATGFVEPTPTTWAMERGHVDEVFARELYNEHTKTEAIEVGFITEQYGTVTIGYSPDGVIHNGDKIAGLIEIKSRAQKYQFETIATGAVPQEYMLQMQTGMLVTGAPWCDFVSYCEGMPLFIARVLPIAEYQDAIVSAAIALDEQIADLLACYKTNANGLPVAERREKHDDGDFV